MVILPRRKLLTGMLGLIAAPAIVRASSLMRVAEWRGPEPTGYARFHDLWRNSVMRDQLDIVTWPDCCHLIEFDSYRGLPIVVSP